MSRNIKKRFPNSEFYKLTWSFLTHSDSNLKSLKDNNA